LLLLVSLLGLGAVSCTAVVELTTADLDARLAQGDWLLEFYAPWCGYCRRLEPVFEEVADSLVVQGVNVARVDGSKYKAVGARFGVKGFPTILHVHNKEVRRHQGDRSKDSLTSFAVEGWKSQAEEFTSPLGTSPFSTSARALGTALEVAVYLQDRYDYVRETFKLSHPVLLGALAVAMIVIGSLWGMLLSYLIPPAMHKNPRGSPEYLAALQSAHAHGHAHTHGGVPCAGHGDLKAD